MVPFDHNPLPIIIDALMTENNFDTDLLPRAMQDTKRYVKELREAYRQTPCKVDYGDKHMRGAYMLAYFPYYIEPVYFVLSQMCIDGMSLIPDRQRISVSAFGSGPTPEALGVMAFLREYHPSCTQAHFSLLDAAADGWQRCTSLCFDRLQSHYWDGEASYSLHRCDLLSRCSQCRNDCTPLIRNADLVIMQNCLNDIITYANSHLVVEKVVSVFRNMQPGAVFVCIDLNFRFIRSALQDIAGNVSTQMLGDVIHNVSQQAHRISRSFCIPQAMNEHLYTGEDGLIARNNVNFYALGLRRTD